MQPWGPDRDSVGMAADLELVAERSLLQASPAVTEVAARCRKTSHVLARWSVTSAGRQKVETDIVVVRWQADAVAAEHLASWSLPTLHFHSTQAAVE